MAVADAIQSRTDAAVVITVALVLVDGLMTLPRWHLEGNPVVLALGPRGMMLAKIVGVLGFAGLWYGYVRTSEYRRIGELATWSLGTLYTVVLVTNVAVMITL